MQATFQPNTERAATSARRQVAWGRVATHLVLILASLTILLPVLWTFRSSLASNDMAYRPADFSFTPTLNNYRQIFVEQNFQRNLWNSFWIAIVGASICLAVGSLAAYSIARSS